MQLWLDTDDRRGNLPLYLLNLMGERRGAFRMEDLELVSWEEGWDATEVRTAILQLEGLGYVRVDALERVRATRLGKLVLP